MDGLRGYFNKILDEYKSSTTQSFRGNPMGTLFRTEVVNALYQSVVDIKKYLIKGSVGQGNWATIPWICIFDRRVTTSATRGVYIVYLLSKDGNTLFLTLNQGCTDLKNRLGKADAVKRMRAVASVVRERIKSDYFVHEPPLELGSFLPELGELYQEGCIYYKGYNKANLPDSDGLADDLKQMLEIYERYAAQETDGDVVEEEGMSLASSEEDRGEGLMDSRGAVRSSIERIKHYIAAKGFSYEDGLVENFYLCLKSKPFVILAGTSGTGKTRLARLFAEAVGASEENGRFKLVSVRPDWSDSSDLFGRADLNGRFIPGVLLKFFKAALSDHTKPYFLCLDEMNLARVEYYLSDLLSVMETRERHGNVILTSPVITAADYGGDVEAAAKYGEITLPQNLYIIGTVNMDETTFPFSRKVLDRANTIEFSFVDLASTPFEERLSLPERLDLDNDFFKTEYLILKECEREKDFATQICAELDNINGILESAGAHVGYRVRDEIVFYMLNNRAGGLLPEEVAADNEILQKILPRIQGSGAAVKKMLCELFKFCIGDYEGYQTESDDAGLSMLKRLDSPSEANEGHRCFNSAKKIALMVRRFEEDGFTSYWF